MSFKKKNVLVTGISGFVGSYLADYLVQQEANVYGLFRRRADGLCPYNIKCRGIFDDVSLLESELLDISSIAAALDKSKPDYIFHLGAQSFVQRSFACPSETMDINCTGTSNLLEAIKNKGINPVIVFAGSSEEYGLVIYSDSQYKSAVKKQGVIFPAPIEIPEVPIKEENPLRPMSPYAVSKVYGDFLMRNYHASFGLRTVVSRGFNHEGAGRGIMFVTSALTKQVMQVKRGEIDRIVVGNVNAFRDWSHVTDIVKGYCLLAEKGTYGDVYNQGSQRTNSVITYALLALECAGYKVEKIQTIKNKKTIIAPTASDKSRYFGLSFEKTKIDKMILDGEIEFRAEDEGLTVFTNKGKVTISFDASRFRPAEVPILLSSTKKIDKLGFKTVFSLRDIINDQLNYYLDTSR
ncbi:MAG: GDP-mannose 4,6-dehydratase [Dehalococcoidia bacterium]